jgi:molecular chaperone GrpE
MKKKGQKVKKAEHEAPEDAAAAPAKTAEGEEPAEAEIHRLKDRLLRLQADFDNHRKRTLRERNDVYRRANEDLMTDLLPVLDHLEMGLRTAREHGVQESVCQGFQMVSDQLMGVLARFGLEPVDAEGQPFDPNLHEAISAMPSEEAPADTVLTQTRRGYRLGDLLLRPAQVVLSHGPGEAVPPAEEPPASES